MFLFRCLFWLSLVYAFILWGEGGIWDRTPLADSVSKGRDAMQAAATQVIGGAARYCADHGSDCMKGAALATSLAGMSPGSTDRSLGERASPAPPLPVPDPRRRADPSLLTRAP